MTNPLVNSDWLFDHRQDADLLIFDARNPNSKVTAKIPNSIYFDLEHVFSDVHSDLPHTMISAGKFQSEVRKLGVNQDSKIVVYDDIGSYWSPRVWWMFRSMGFDDVFVLDGGLKAWERSGFETVENYRSGNGVGSFVANYDENFFSSAQDLLDSINENSATIVDARNSDRYNGLAEEPRKGLRRGHIPTAINIPFENCLSGSFLKPKSELEEIFKNIDRRSKLIFSCGSGVTACIVALSATIAGFKDIRVYDGSWSEWGRGNFPIV